MLGAKVIHLEELLGVDAQEPDEDDENNILLARDEVMRNMNIFGGIPRERYPEIIQKLGGYEEAYEPNDIVWNQGEGRNCIGIILQGIIQATEMSGKEPQIIQQFRAGECFGEAVAFGEQKSWAEIRATKATRILYLPVDGLMKDMSDCDFTLMKTNLVREMSNKIAILKLKNQILAEPRLRKRILIYLNILPADKAGWKEVPFGQKELAQYLNANRSALSRELARMREDGLIETEGHKVKVLLTINELMML